MFLKLYTFFLSISTTSFLTRLIEFGQAFSALEEIIKQKFAHFACDDKIIC